MVWPNVSVTVGYTFYQMADLTPFIKTFVGHDYPVLPDPFLENGMTGNWAAPPAIAGNTYATMAAFEADWYTSNVGATPITMTYPHFVFIGCGISFAAGTVLDWGASYSIGDLQNVIEVLAAGALQTPEQYLAAQDPINRAKFGGLPDPGYCFYVAMQEALVTPSPEGVLTGYPDGIGIPPNDILGDCGPQTFEAGISVPIAVLFFNFATGVFQPPMHSISLNQTGGMSGVNQSPYEKDKPKGTTT